MELMSIIDIHFVIVLLMDGIMIKIHYFPFASLSAPGESHAPTLSTTAFEALVRTANLMFYKV